MQQTLGQPVDCTAGQIPSVTCKWLSRIGTANLCASVERGDMWDEFPTLHSVGYHLQLVSAIRYKCGKQQTETSNTYLAL